MKKYTIDVENNNTKINTLVLIEYDDGTYKHIPELLSSSALDNDVFLDSSKDFDNPYLVVEGGSDNVTQLFNVYKACNGNVPDNIIDKLILGLSGKISKEELIEIFKAFGEYSDYSLGKKVVKIKVPPSQYKNFVSTKNLVKKINSSSTTVEVFVEGDNVTKFRENENSELFIEVPSYDSLLVNIDSTVPSASKVEQPYKEYNSQIVDILESIDYSKILVSIGLDKSYVEGNPINNTLPIQNSEMRWQKALRSLMDVGMCREHPDLTLEECKEKKLVSKIVMDYLKKLALLGFRINWKHSELLVMFEDEEEEDEGRDSDGLDDNGNEVKDTEGVATNEGFSEAAKARFDKIGFRPADSTIEACLKYSIQKDGVYAPIDIVIKLFRFGKLKPDRIPVGDKWYDMFNSVISDNIDELASAKVYKDENGNDLFPCWIIYLNNQFKNTVYQKELGVSTNYQLYDIPIGIVCQRRYVDSDAISLVCLSMFDLINGMNSESSPKIDGITFKDGKVIVSEDLDELFLDRDYVKYLDEIVETAISNGFKRVTYWNYKGFIETYFDKECYSTNISILQLLYDLFNADDLQGYSSLSYEDMEELDAIILSNHLAPSTVISANICNKIIPIITDINEKLKNIDEDVIKFSSIVALYEAYINNTKFSWYFNNNNKKKEEPVVTVNKSESFTEKSTLVTSNDNFIRGLSDDMEIYPITISKDLLDSIKGDVPELKVLGTVMDKPVIGLIGMSPNKTKVLLDLSTNREYLNRDISVPVILCYLLRGIKRMTLGKPLETFYESKEAMAYYSKLFEKSIIKSFK